MTTMAARSIIELFNHPSEVSIMLRSSLPITTRRSVRVLLSLCAVGVLAACGTAPNSYLYDRQVYYKAQLNRYPVFVVAVDGSTPGFRPIPLTMGEHIVALDAVPVAGFVDPVRKVYSLTIAPCTRYYLAAQRASPLLQDWDLVVETTFSSGGCDPAVELREGPRGSGEGTAAAHHELDRGVDVGAPHPAAGHHRVARVVVAVTAR